MTSDYLIWIVSIGVVVLMIAFLGFSILRRRDLEIEAYKKALELDPKFEHAKEMLKRLGGT